MTPWMCVENLFVREFCVTSYVSAHPRTQLQLQLTCICEVFMNAISPREVLRDAGLRATQPRLAVLAALQTAERPVTHADLVRELVATGIDQATVYRNLKRLEEVGLVRAASQLGGVTRYELRSGEEVHAHPHFVCVECEQVQCVPELALSGQTTSGWASALANARVEIVGVCPGCNP